MQKLYIPFEGGWKIPFEIMQKGVHNFCHVKLNLTTPLLLGHKWPTPYCLIPYVRINLRICCLDVTNQFPYNISHWMLNSKSSDAGSNHFLVFHQMIFTLYNLRFCMSDTWSLNILWCVAHLDDYTCTFRISRHLDAMVSFRIVYNVFWHSHRNSLHNCTLHIRMVAMSLQSKINTFNGHF